MTIKYYKFKMQAENFHQLKQYLYSLYTGLFFFFSKYILISQPRSLLLLYNAILKKLVKKLKKRCAKKSIHKNLHQKCKPRV